VDGWNGSYGSVKLNWTSTITQPLNVSVTGRVAEGAQGLAGVFVGLYDDSGALLQQTTTDTNGRWTFASVGVSRGYALAFVKSGYTLTPNGFPVQVGTSALDVGDVTAVKANPIEETSFFVAQHYRDFLGREADAEGLAFWTNEIEQCGVDRGCREVKRVNVSAAFFQSIEFQNTGYLVERMYKAAYGDATGTTTITGTPTNIPVPLIRRAEFLSDTAALREGVVVNVGDWEQRLEANKNSFALAFVQRQRFTNALPLTMTAEQFVDKLFANAGVTPTAGERDGAVSAFGSGGAAGSAAALRKVAESATFDAAEKNRAFVLMQFFGYLQRDPNATPDLDHTGWKFWLDKLEEFNGNYIAAEMVKAFLDSTEYRRRFGQ
jgi:hypothetical protein